MSKIINVGRVTSYADAVAGGYTGTREQWEHDLANLGTVAAEVEADRAEVAENTATVAEDKAAVEEDRSAAESAAGSAAESAASAHTDAIAATAAKEAAQTAQGLAENAASTAANAKDAAQTAQGAAEDAQTAAEAAQTGAEDAQTAAAGSASAAAESATAAAESEATAQHIADMYPTDKTLSVVDKAADGKATGDAVADLKSALESEDTFINEALSYINYGYDTPYYQAEGSGTWSKTTGINRDKQIIILNRHATYSSIIRIKVSGAVEQAASSSQVDAWSTGLSLVTGHEYVATIKLLSGTSYTTDPNNTYIPCVAIYRAGLHTGWSVPERTDNIAKTAFTAEDNTQYNIAIMLDPGEWNLTDAKFLITLEDLTISSRKKTEDDIAQINSDITDINNELSTRLALAINDATDITNGTDYNTIINSGNYVVRTAESVATMTNSPTTAAHRLIVSSLTAATRIFQIVITYNNNIFFRTKSSGNNTDLSTGWTAWKKVADVDTIEAEIAELKPDSLPDYYFTDDYIDDRMSTILTNRRTIGTPSVEFAFFTDPHFYDGTISKVQNGMQHIGLLSYLRRKTNITDIICGGDLVNDNSMTVAECLALFSGVRKYLDPLWDHLFMIIGNHEWNNPALETAQEVNEMTFNQLYTHWLADKSRKFESLDTDCGSYYFDDAVNKVRYIMLGTTDGGNISFNQLKWIRDTMLSTPDGYTVACISHISLTAELAYIGKFGEVVNLLDAAKTKGTWSYSFPGTSNPLTADFTNKNIDVACVISGHIHRDLSVYSTGGIPVVTTVCDRGPRSTTSEAFNEARAYGTTNEQAIDVCQIDLQNKKIYMTRIGGSFDGTAPLQKPDREFTF